jgi:hypothetical protein
MSDVDRLLNEYIEEHRAGGGGDPVAFLDQLEGVDREELATLIDGYLQRAPAREWDQEAFRDSGAERLTESLNRSLTGRAGIWPVVLPRLRERARVLRADLTAQLAETLGVRDKRDKVEAYYHAMEQGSLDSVGVSDDVLEAIGRIVGASAESLRRAGAAMGEAGSERAAEGAAFTRVQGGKGVSAEAKAPSAPAEGAEERGDWDEVDELFRGG